MRPATLDEVVSARNNNQAGGVGGAPQGMGGKGLKGQGVYRVMKGRGTEAKNRGGWGREQEIQIQ